IGTTRMWAGTLRSFPRLPGVPWAAQPQVDDLSCTGCVSWLNPDRVVESSTQPDFRRGRFQLGLQERPLTLVAGTCRQVLQFERVALEIKEQPGRAVGIQHQLASRSANSSPCPVTLVRQ